MITKESATEIAQAILRKMEVKMQAFGSALSGNSENPKTTLAISRIDEHADIGWVFFYKSKLLDDAIEIEHALAGNAPFIVENTTGAVYGTGTARPIEFFLEEFRLGVRRPMIE